MSNKAVGKRGEKQTHEEEHGSWIYMMNTDKEKAFPDGHVEQ